MKTEDKTINLSEEVAAIVMTNKAAIINLEEYRKMSLYVASIVTPDQLNELKTTYNFEIHTLTLNEEA